MDLATLCLFLIDHIALQLFQFVRICFFFYRYKALSVLEEGNTEKALPTHEIYKVWFHFGMNRNIS